MHDAIGLHSVARRQGGAFSRDQATTAGHTSRSLATALARGHLVLRHPDVFVLPGPRTATAEDWAAYLAGGPGAVASAWSAARHLGLQWDELAPGEPCVAVPPQLNIRLSGVRVLRWTLPPEHTDVLGRMRVTTQSRTVVDCLRLAPRHRAEGMLDRALLQRWITVHELATLIRQLAGQRGVPVLRSLLADVTGGARSRAERLTQDLVSRTGVSGWQWNYQVTLAGGAVAILDAALPRLRIAVEIDGRAYHVDPDRFQRDRTKQNALVAAGWTVLRFTWSDLTRRPDYVIETIRRAVALAS
jgi:very-short-patch-repair endonuclease